MLSPTCPRRLINENFRMATTITIDNRLGCQTILALSLNLVLSSRLLRRSATPTIAGPEALY